MLQVKQFTEYAYAPNGQVFNSLSHIPILWQGADEKVMKRFDDWRQGIKKENIVGVTGPTHTTIEPGCGYAMIKVLYEDEA